MKVSNKSIFHIVQTIFTGKEDAKNVFDRVWLKNRIELFKKFTLKSLLNQTNRNFLHWILWRPEEKTEPLVQDLAKFLKEINYQFVFTFFSTPYFNENQEPEVVDSLPKRLEKSLEFVKGFHIDEEVVYLTVIDSDDMFYKGATEEIQSYDYEFKRALYFTKGYAFEIQSKRLAEWNPTTCPPFYTIFQPSEVFFDSIKHLEYRKGLIFHKHIPKVFNSIPLEGRKFMYGIHSLNDTTFWNNSYKGKEYLDEKEKVLILKDFGIEYDRI